MTLTLSLYPDMIISDNGAVCPADGIDTCDVNVTLIPLNPKMSEETKIFRVWE